MTRIRRATLRDAEALARVLAAERAFMAPYEPVRPDAFYTVDGQREVLLGRLERASSGLEVYFVIVDDGGEVVGALNLGGVVHGAYQSCTMGYWVAGAANGRGYASQAVAEAVAHAFGDLALHRVEAGTLLDNARSQRVLEKNGFERIGTAPRLVRIAGEWRDHHLFQRLAD